MSNWPQFEQSIKTRNPGLFQGETLMIKSAKLLALMKCAYEKGVVDARKENPQERMLDVIDSFFKTK